MISFSNIELFMILRCIFNRLFIVYSFFLQLSSLYEVKPPISKAKMTAITRGAIKAIKFYKHVVQSVEKFILKCKSEYKVPGLYVIDSIVRQSRHQFGPDKDVFAPRFAKNMRQTFINLFSCPAEDKVWCFYFLHVGITICFIVCYRVK